MKPAVVVTKKKPVVKKVKAVAAQPTTTPSPRAPTVENSSLIRIVKQQIDPRGHNSGAVSMCDYYANSWARTATGTTTHDRLSALQGGVSAGLKSGNMRHLLLTTDNWHNFIPEDYSMATFNTQGAVAFVSLTHREHKVKIRVHVALPALCKNRGELARFSARGQAYACYLKASGTPGSNKSRYDPAVASLDGGAQGVDEGGEGGKVKTTFIYAIGDTAPGETHSTEHLLNYYIFTVLTIMHQNNFDLDGHVPSPARGGPSALTLFKRYNHLAYVNAGIAVKSPTMVADGIFYDDMNQLLDEDKILQLFKSSSTAPPIESFGHLILEPSVYVQAGTLGVTARVKRFTQAARAVITDAVREKFVADAPLTLDENACTSVNNVTHTLTLTGPPPPTAPIVPVFRVVPGKQKVTPVIHEISDDEVEEEEDEAVEEEEEELLDDESEDMIEDEESEHESDRDFINDESDAGSETSGGDIVMDDEEESDDLIVETV